MTINERIREIRKLKNLSQTSFGESFYVSRDVIANIELGRVEPSDMIIRAVCREFSVNEAWLRTGVGEMFLPRSSKDEIAGFLGTILGGKATPYQEWLVSFLATTGPDEWKLLEAKTRELYESLHKFYEDK